MKDWSIGWKIRFGFGFVLTSFILVSGWSIFGIDNIVQNAAEVIDGNELKKNIVQKEIDHLNWAVELNKLLTDDSVKKVTVEKDHTKCAFGKWLYGEGRKTAEALVPALKPVLQRIEQPHKALHDTAITIDEEFVHKLMQN